jgi:sporulation protein YlmC with PRC-barrel domain
MLRAGSSLRGYRIAASDGPIGTVADLLFDDKSWKVRWVVVDTGTWLAGRKVLIHPSVAAVNFETQMLSVVLTKAKVKDSPSIMQDQPVSRQMEYELNDYFAWDPYDRGAIGVPLTLAQRERADADTASRKDDADPHLRSLEEVTGYHVHAADGMIGHLENLLIDDQKWTINYLIIDTRNWWPGQHVLLAPAAVKEFDWSERQVRLDVTRAMVKGSPSWDPAVIVDQAYQKRLHLHYGWPGFGW